MRAAFPQSMQRGLRRGFGAALLLAVALAGGCTTQEDIRRMAGLGDLEATSPAGRKCYEQCAMYRATCRHMCPSIAGDCGTECDIETKFCLVDCPDLKRVTPVPEE